MTALNSNSANSENTWPGTYAADRTGLLIVDPYNDFMSEGGKLFEMTKASREKADTFKHMKQVIEAARAAGIQVFIVPHHRSHPEDFKGWKFANPFQLAGVAGQPFAEGTWGGEFNVEFGPKQGDVIVKEHWAQSGFANTDLSAQLQQHSVTYIILIGMVANTCIESTGRYGMEQGYHVTLVKDATAAFSLEGMHAAHEINGPTFAHAILTTEELLPLMPEAK